MNLNPMDIFRLLPTWLASGVCYCWSFLTSLDSVDTTLFCLFSTSLWNYLYRLILYPPDLKYQNSSCLRPFSLFTSYSVPRLAHYASGFRHHLYVDDLQMCKAAHSRPRVPFEISGLMSEKAHWAQCVKADTLLVQCDIMNVKAAFIMSPSPQTWFFAGIAWFGDPCSLTFAKFRLALEYDISLSLFRHFPQ